MAPIGKELSKAEEITLIDKLCTLSGYFYCEFTEAELIQIKSNIRNDFPFFLGTRYDKENVIDLKVEIDELHNQLKEQERINIVLSEHNVNLKSLIQLEKDFRNEFVKELLSSGITDLVYEKLPIKDITMLKVKAGMNLHDDEIEIVLDSLK